MPPGWFRWSLVAIVHLKAVQGQDKVLDEGAPVATPAVQRLLDQAMLAANAGDVTRALGFADDARQVSRQTADAPGEALAQRIRALHLVKLDRRTEAKTAWREAEAAWQRAQDGPGQVEALGWQAVLEGPEDSQKGTALLQQAIGLAQMETKRPRGATSGLVGVGRALLDNSLFNEAQNVYAAGAAIAERIGRGSLEHASGLNGLGLVAYNRGDLKTARDYHEKALAIRNRLAPNSLDAAESLNKSRSGHRGLRGSDWGTTASGAGSCNPRELCTELARPGVEPDKPGHSGSPPR